MPTLTNEKKPQSPIREQPLPQAGESLRDEFQERLIDTFGLYMMAYTAIVFAGLAWAVHFFPNLLSPWHTTVISGVIAAVCVWKARKKWSLLRDIALGRKGERAVADALEVMKESGYRIYHDVQEDGFNIDHVLIGPAGVFAIETKTRRKRGNETVVFDGEKVTVAGKTPDRDPVVQARASARRVRDILKEQTGNDIWVKPVVLFPGWFVERRGMSDDIFVGNQKLLLKSFDYEHREERLTPQQVSELSRGFERHLRRERPN